MRSSMLLTLGAIAFALAAAPAVASEDAAPDASAMQGVQAAAAPVAASDSVDSVQAPAQPSGDVAATDDAQARPALADVPQPAMEADSMPAAPDPLENSDSVGDDAPPAATAGASAGTEASADADAMAGADASADAGAMTGADASADAPATAGAEAEAGPAAEAATSAPDAAAGATLGSVGYDAQGRRGRIHIVVPGDTLWDISDAYLGTPWVWPSIWKDNRDIADPHWIYPGDRIWITPSEMRIVSPEEAEKLLSARPPQPAGADEAPAAPDANAEPSLAEDLGPQTPTASETPETRLVSEIEAVGLVTSEAYDASASIVEAQPDRVMLSQEDQVYIGLGAGDVEVGDQFTIFRKQEPVFDPDTHRLIGYHVDILGWLAVTEVRDESSLAVIHQSTAEIERGDRVMPRQFISPEVTVMPSPSGVDGRIAFFAQSRTMMAGVDYVYLNRGTLDGVEAGSPLEVYRPGRVAEEPARHTTVKVPDRVVAQLLVVKAEPNASVAFVSESETELAVGDRFRGATR